MKMQEAITINFASLSSYPS